ncbi:MAG: glycoside hydrolase family 13 protein [Clostridiales bacterium]|nr:glycoside hydrolase family 13 protein [Clostridiales bacterium]
MQIFNSRKTEYKSIVSAIAENEKVKLRIIVPRSMRCSCARLAVCKENESMVYYNMFWAGMCTEQYEYWELHFYATTYGLYFYHFELETPWGVSVIKNIGNGIGDFSADGSEFQQTVYDKDFRTPDFLKGGLIYQIFPDRFFNSGQPKTNVPKGRVLRKWGEEPFWSENQMHGKWNNDYFGGDLKGIEQKLPYIKSLGVTCIYLNPIFEAHSNHRYDTADYENIDPLLGSEDDLKSLCKSAEKMGIAVILDGVFSHTGCDSKYFNMYGRYNTVGAYNSKKSPYFSWYKFIDYPDNYKCWWGIKLLPEVCEENETYREYICGENGILHKWMRCGISGWRLDVADELPDVFLDDLRKSVKSENENAVIIGEVWEDTTTKTAYGKRRRYLLGSQLDSVMNYPFADAVLNFIRYGGASNFLNSIMAVVENYPPCALNILMNHIGTHDTARAVTRLAGENSDGCNREWQYAHNVLSENDYKRGTAMLKAASLIQYTLPGVPSLYYGDEAGMQGMKDPFNRACFPWDNINDELLKWYKRLGEIRNGCKAFKDGSFLPVASVHNAAAYARISLENQVLVAVNACEESVEIYVGAQWDNSYNIFKPSSKNGIISLGAYEYALLSK